MFLGKAWNSILAFFGTRLPEFLNNNFEITSTKRSKLIGSVLSFVTLIAVILDVNAYTSQDFASKWLLLAFALFCPFILGFTAFGSFFFFEAKKFPPFFNSEFGMRNS